MQLILSVTNKLSWPWLRRAALALSLKARQLVDWPNWTERSWLISLNAAAIPFESICSSRLWSLSGIPIWSQTINPAWLSRDSSMSQADRLNCFSWRDILPLSMPSPLIQFQWSHNDWHAPGSLEWLLLLTRSCLILEYQLLLCSLDWCSCWHPNRVLTDYAQMSAFYVCHDLC